MPRHLIILALIGAMHISLAISESAGPTLPPGCPPSGSAATPMPGQLPNGTAYLDYVLAETGQCVQIYYNKSLGLAAELVRKSPNDFSGPAEYRLYDYTHGQDVSYMPSWPNSQCNASNASLASLGPELAEIRDTVFNNSTSPCLLMLLAPDLADAHGHSGGGPQLRSLAWTDNHTACFSGNDTIINGVWRVQIQLDGKDKTDVSSVSFELLYPSDENRTVWSLSNRRTYSFLASQHSPPPTQTVSNLANTPAFVACGAVRERLNKPPKIPDSMINNIRLEIDNSIIVANDALARTRELTPSVGDRLYRAYGPSRLRLVADRALLGATFVIGLQAGNCSLDRLDDSVLAEPLPFNLSRTDWLWTGDGVQFQGRPGCGRFLLPEADNLTSYEVYFCGGLKFENLAGYSRHRRHGNNDSTPAEVTNFAVTEVSDASAQPVEYDLTACSLLEDGGNASRLLMRIEAGFKELSTKPPSNLTAAVRSLVAMATNVSPLRVAKVSLANDANASLSQVWLTLMGPPANTTSPTGASPDQPLSLDKTFDKFLLAVHSGSVNFFDRRIASLELASNATDATGRGGGGGGGGGGSPIYIHDGHSGGAMAALAFFMLLVGGGCGVLGAWCVWKRRPNMPYYVQD